MAVEASAIRGLVIDVPTSLDLAQPIALAGAIMSEFFSDTTLSEAMQAQIELLIACHYTVLFVEKGGLVRQSMGESANTYREIHQRLGGFLSTRFGSDAVMLDSTGVLSALTTSQPKAEFQVF